jgi:hypothetical protein
MIFDRIKKWSKTPASIWAPTINEAYAKWSDGGIIVTSRKLSVGRPETGTALTGAERQARRREKVETEKARLARALFQARDSRDWSAVEAIARSLIKL